MNPFTESSRQTPRHPAAIATRALLASGLLLFAGNAICRAADEPKDIVVEAESLKTSGAAEVVEMKDASGGKAVLFKAEGGVAEGEISLPAGTYTMAIYVQGVDSDHDAVMVYFDAAESRVFGMSGEFSNADFADGNPTVVCKTGKVKLKLKTGEPDVHVDRIVFTPVK